MPIAYPHRKWNFFVNIDVHDGYFVAPPAPLPVPGKAWHVGAGVFAAAFAQLEGGTGLGVLKGNDGKVTQNSWAIVSRGHEVRYCVYPHINVKPFPPSQPNVLIPLLILGSSSKCLFANVRVRGKDGPIALSMLAFLGLNQACGDPCNYPTSFVINWSHVKVGWRLGDLVVWLFLVGWDAASSGITSKLFSKHTGPKMRKAGELGQRVVQRAVQRFPALGKRMPRGLQRAFSNGVRTIAQRLNPGAGKDGKTPESVFVKTAETVFKALFGEMFGGQFGANRADKWKSNTNSSGWKTFHDYFSDPLGLPGEKISNKLRDLFDKRAETLPTQ
jgi:hypothetical protein